MSFTRFVRLIGFEGLDSPRIAQRLFLAIGAPTILLLCFLTGPFEAPDEAAHYMRMVSVADGHWLPFVSAPIGGKRAAGTYEDVAVADLANGSQSNVGWAMHHYSISELRNKAAVRESGKVAFAAHYESVYPPFLYASSAGATAVARALHFPPFWWLYVGRLANAFISVLLVQAALKRAGDESLLAFACAMLPMNLYLFASLSADALLLPLVFAFVIILLRIARAEPQSPREQWALVGCTLLVSAGKVAYLPFALLPPLCFRSVDKRWSSRARWSVGVAILSLALWGAWAAVVHDKIFSIRPNIVVDPKAQLLSLLSNPAQSLLFFLHWMIALTPKIILGAVGGHLGWGDLRLPNWLVYPLPLLVLTSVVFANQPTRRPLLLVLAATLVGLVCYCAVFLLLYLQYNAVGARSIEGLQGRYFMPIILLLAAMTPRLKVGEKRMASIWIAAGTLAVASSVVTLMSIYLRYW